jgi:hypothetical protein
MSPIDTTAPLDERSAAWLMPLPLKSTFAVIHWPLRVMLELFATSSGGSTLNPCDWFHVKTVGPDWPAALRPFFARSVRYALTIGVNCTPCW